MRGTILAVYDITEMKPIRSFLKIEDIPFLVIRTPEWMKKQDFMYCNHCILIELDSKKITEKLISGRIFVRSIFVTEMQLDELSPVI